MPEDAELLAFAAAHPWEPAWPAAQLELFLGRLISGPRQVLRLERRGRLRAAAVLLDKVDNPGACACLEFLGASEVLEPADFAEILAWADTRLGSRHRGFQIGEAPARGLTAAVLRALGCSPYYDMYDMRCSTPGQRAGHEPDERAKALDEADFSAYYDLLVAAFAENPDTCVTDRQTAYTSWLGNPASHIWMIWNQSRPLAFVHLFAHGPQAEIRTLGVAPAARGQGLGQALLGHALHWARDQGFAPVELSVAVRNTRALNLYEQMGFERLGATHCWLRPARPQPA